MKTKKELLLDLGISKGELKRWEKHLMKNDSDVKKAYNFRLLLVISCCVGGLFLAKFILPEIPSLFHWIIGCLFSLFPSWLMTVYAVNPALAVGIDGASETTMDE